MATTLSPEDQFINKLNSFNKCREYAYSSSNRHVNCICRYLINFYNNPIIILTDKGYQTIADSQNKVNMYYDYPNAYKKWYMSLQPIPKYIAMRFSPLDMCIKFSQIELSEDVINAKIGANDHNMCRILYSVLMNSKNGVYDHKYGKVNIKKLDIYFCSSSMLQLKWFNQCAITNEIIIHLFTLGCTYEVALYVIKNFVITKELFFTFLKNYKNRCNYVLHNCNWSTNYINSLTQTEFDILIRELNKKVKIDKEIVKGCIELKFKIDEPEKNYGMKLDKEIFDHCCKYDFFPYGMFVPFDEKNMGLVIKKFNPLEMKKTIERNKITPTKEMLNICNELRKPNHFKMLLTLHDFNLSKKDLKKFSHNFKDIVIDYVCKKMDNEPLTLIDFENENYMNKKAYSDSHYDSEDDSESESEDESEKEIIEESDNSGEESGDETDDTYEESESEDDTKEIRVDAKVPKKVTSQMKRLLKIKKLQITPLEFKNIVVEYIFKKKLINAKSKNVIKLDDNLKKVLGTKISPLNFEEVEDLIEKWAKA